MILIYVISSGRFLCLIAPRNTMKYDIGHPGPGLGQAQKCGRVNAISTLYS